VVSIQLTPELMHADVAQIHAEQQAIGYPSTLVEGERDCRAYMRSIFADWRARNITCVLHEKRGGYANNMASLRGLAAKAEAAGARVVTGVRVTDFEVDGAGAVTAVHTDCGGVRCETLVIAVGPWVRDLWRMLDLPETVTVKGRDGRTYDRPMWTYWSLQEGTVGVDPGLLVDNDGNLPPVVHVDTDAPLYDDTDGSLVTDRLWGIYYKPDFSFGGVQGGTVPFVIEQPANDVAVDPYGPASPDFIVGADFQRLFTSGLAHCHQRLQGKGDLFRRDPSGGIGCFTPDSFPVFDVFRGNAYVIADSNHGYKMIGVGALVAAELLGDRKALLEPFRFSRYAEGRLHPVSHSPFPWS
jgi:methylglutamate dehydrogenase subunit A